MKRESINEQIETPSRKVKIETLPYDFDHIETLLEVHDTLTLAQLRLQAQEGPHKGKTGWWLLVDAAAKGNQIPFQKAFKKFEDQLTLADFQAKAEAGDDQGKTVLWLLVEGLSTPQLYNFNYYDTYFLTALLKFDDELTLADFQTKADAGDDRGKTVLWLLAKANTIEEDVYGLFFEDYMGQLTLADFRTKAEAGDDRGKTVLWLLASITSTSGGPLEEFIYEKFKDQLTLEDFQTKAEAGDDQGKTVWWQLTIPAVDEDYTVPFEYAFEKFKDQLTFEDLQTKEEAGNSQGTTVLTRLAVFDHIYLEPLLFAFKKFAHQFTLNDLQAKIEKIEIGQDVKEKTIQCILMKWALNTDPDFASYTSELKRKVRYILAYIPQAYNSQEIATDAFRRLINKHPENNNSWWAHTRDLIASRNVFFDKMGAYQTASDHTEIDVAKLEQLAKNATTLGYLNAFFDLATFYLDKGLQEQAIEAYRQVPKDSRDYFKATEIAAQGHFALALSQPSSFNRNRFLSTSLECALKLADGDREKYIQQIALCYVTEGKMLGLENTDIVPAGWIQAMNENTPVAWCMERFDEIKASREQLARINALEAEVRLLKQQAAERKSIESLLATITRNSPLHVAPVTQEGPQRDLENKEHEDVVKNEPFVMWKPK